MAPLTVRPMGPEDAGIAAAAVLAVQPHHPWSEDEVRDYWRFCSRMGSLRDLVIEEDGLPVGWITSTLRTKAPEGEGRVFTFLAGGGEERLDPAWAFAEAAVRDLGARLAVTNVWEDSAAELAVLERRGWERKRRERFWRLELAGQRERLLELRDAALQRVEAAGVRIVTVAELGGEAVYPELHKVDEASAADIPRTLPYVPIPYEAWLEWWRPPGVTPERVWVAVRDGRPVGHSHLNYRATPVETGYTGVLREHRGVGVARALKLETVLQAIDLGVEAVETDNDSENTPILHLNEELGYREIAGQLRLHKPL